MTNQEPSFSTITAFIFDIDGVFTDGSILALDTGEQARRFNVRDTYALSLAVRAGYHVMVISSSNQQSIRLRLEATGMRRIYLNVTDKMARYQQVLQDAELGLREYNVLYMGDDLQDYDILKRPGLLSCCPADAVEEIKAICKYISPNPGGHMAVRDVIEQVLKAQGRWVV